jgi:molecular chaperone GrpE
LIHKQFEDALQKVGVTKLMPKGEIFDPKFHEAVMLQDSDQPAHTVLEVLQPGYTIHDKLLRPAMVIVAKEK